MTRLDFVDAPYWNNSCSLPDFLTKIADEMRAGTWSPSIEACLLVKNMESAGLDKETGAEIGIITICRWGEDDGLLNHGSLKSIAENSRTTA